MLKNAYSYWKAQTWAGDWEWIIADDGSSDGTQEWCEDNEIAHVYQEDNGYRLTEILNKAGKVARGEHLVWVMADSYPKSVFLEELNKVVAEDRMTNGLRMNVDKNKRIVSPDWRTDYVLFDIDADEVDISDRSRPWRMMTLNSMSMPRDAYNEMGGIFEGYDGYGKMDWDMAAWAFHHGLKLYWAPKAIIYHFEHPDRKDTEASETVFNQRLKSFIEKTA